MLTLFWFLKGLISELTFICDDEEDRVGQRSEAVLRDRDVSPKDHCVSLTCPTLISDARRSYRKNSLERL